MRDIIQSSNPVLRSKSAPVANCNYETKQLIEEMILLCRTHRALGLSAPQLGVLSRVIVCKYGEDYVGIINPEIVKKSDRTVPSVEGCLSISGGKRKFTVIRSKIVKVKGRTTNGKPVTYKGRDAFGVSLQHEIDHLDGILISDKGTVLL